MGNGFPVAAVVTRADIVERFARDRHLFSTFGGNPVAAAAAMAVLDVVEREDLPGRAMRIGEHLRAELAELAGRHEAIGDVRGAGLLIGVDLVLDRKSREPDRALASEVADGMRQRGVLVGTTGSSDNVLKIRPPLVVSIEDADRVVAVLDETLTATARS
jgi:4-aminobutyrate aminotransferase-like enzyme